MSTRKIFRDCSWRYDFDGRSFFLFHNQQPIGIYFANAKQFCINETIYDPIMESGKNHIAAYAIWKYLGEKKSTVYYGWMRDEEIVFLNRGTLQHWIDN